MDANTLIDLYFGRADGQFAVGGIPLAHIGRDFGTPVFVYDQAILKRKLTALRDALPPEFEVCYSVKANPNQDILKFFLGHGCGLEIASAGEFEQARAAGCAASKILFAGPGKGEEELEHVLAGGIGEIHAESLREIERINGLAQRLGVTARVAIRVNPTGEAEGGAMRMGGKPAPFGIDEEILDETLDALLACPHIRFSGIHLFSGTQILDAAILVDQYKHGLEVARRVVARIGHPVPTVDFGGGLGIPYFAHEQPLDLTQLKAALAQLWPSVREDTAFRGTRFFVEPGRFLVGEAGLYVTRVNDVKTSRGKKFVIVNGGMHHHLAASGNLGQTIKRNYPIANVSRMSESSLGDADVVGPLCTPLDVLGRAVQLPKSEVGDLIVVFQSGAYARAASPLQFLSHASPAEVYVEGGKAHLSRDRGSVEDYLRDQFSLTNHASH